MGRGLQVSPDDLEIAGVLSPTWHICNSAGKQRPPRKVDPDASLSLVHNRMSLGTIELNAHMYCLMSSLEGILSRKQDVYYYVKL